MTEQDTDDSGKSTPQIASLEGQMGRADAIVAGQQQLMKGGSDQDANCPQSASVITLDQVCKSYTLYFIGYADNYACVQQKPFGHDLVGMDCLDLQHETFADLLNQLDGIAYGDKNLAMPKWVAIDCAMMPSGIVGVATPVEACPPELLAKFDIPSGYTGLVPLSEFCGVPLLSGGFFGHTCATAIQGQGIGLFSKLLGMQVFDIKKYHGIAQYDNMATKTHTKISDLHLKSAVTGPHSEKMMTYIYTQVPPASPREIFELEKPMQAYSFLLDHSDPAMKLALHEKIKAGEQYAIVYPGVIKKDGKVYTPICTV